MVKLPFEKKHTAHPIDVAKLIDKGAPVKGDEMEEDKHNTVSINLRMRKAMLKDIDETVAEEAHRQGICLSRTAWILQLIHKEMKRLRNEKK